MVCGCSWITVSGAKTIDDCVIGHSSNCNKRKAFISEQVQYVINYRLCDGVMCTLKKKDENKKTIDLFFSKMKQY